MSMTSSSSPITREPDKILVEQKLGAKILTLNRPEQLNAISDAMMSHLLELLLDIEEDSSVKLIILKGKGRSFSCGGDVQQAARCVVEGDWKTILDNLRKAYTLNYVIATYSKPQVSILDGIVMGTGAGISIHGRFRVATENSLFAMPETSLGLFPDMGASYFLSRLPGFFGEYVGLTGARLDGAEMLACGVATHFVKSEKLPLLEAALIRADSNDPSVISFVIGGFSHIPTLKTSSAYHRLNVINKCFSRRTVEEIIEALETEADRRDKWITWTIQSMKKASPTSLKIFLRSIRRGRLQGISKCLIQEFRMVARMCDGELSRDFVEGSRAILLDKNKNPKWNPSNLESVSDDMVDQFFVKVTADLWDDLKLPARPNVTTYAVAKL